MKKGLIQKIFLCLMICVMVVFGMEIFREFMANHTYYYDMFKSGKNWGVVIAGLICSLIPILYVILKGKKFSIIKFGLSIFLGALVFGFVNLIIRGSLIGNGVLTYIINEFLLFMFGAVFLVGTLAFGTWLSKLILKFKENRIQELFLNFGIGLSALLLIWQTLIGFGLFYNWLCWIMLLGLGFLIRYEKDSLKEYSNILGESICSLNDRSGENRWKYVLIILLVFSLVYYFYGFQLSFIPYSTAWDANHEYMYVPKVIAGNHGLIWGNVGTANSMPYLWHTFIAFWFGIGSVFTGNRLSPDTIAVAMNFISGPLCLIFGLLLVKEVLDFFTPKKDDENVDVNGISFAGGWTTLLLWLTSGMGAFLIFVDNKTDLGVMALTILAILSGFIFIRYISEHDKKGMDKESIKYLVISGLLFAMACMSKPTAFIDVAIFGVLLCALWINSFVGFGVGIMGLGMMGILKPLTAAEMMTESLGKYLIIIGLIIAILGLVMMFLRERKEISKKRTLFTYIVIWAVALVGSLVIFKGPWLAYKQITITHDFSIGNWGKNLIMSYNNEESRIKNVERSEIPQSEEEGRKLLLATTEEYVDLERQNEIDREYLSSGAENEENLLDSSLRSEGQISEGEDKITPEQCLKINYSDEELEEGMRDAPTGNEDLGRYVGYGWKEFNNSHRLSYKLLRLFYPKNNKCYGVNSDAKILCENQEYISAGNIEKIKAMELKPGSDAAKILEEGLLSYQENPDTLMDLINNLTAYYQSHCIYTEKGKLFMPYRYIVPLNITFNWSLQNLSSYYTDIGFVWVFVFVFLIFSFIYSIIKKDKKLFAASMSTIIGWAIWRVIGSAILWYGVGLLMWTALVMAMYINDLLRGEKKGISTLGALMIAFFGVFVLIQFFYNFIRIASQGSTGPFLWYKQSVGNVETIEDNMNVTQKVKIGYSQKDVFDLQFPQYNEFIEYVKDRKDEDGVLIAGTYLQYFLDNQKNIKLDGSLDWFREQGSDGDTCKMYQRLRNANIKYLVIDPNIASIVMGDGNKSLFYRFFAKTNENGKIVEKGALMMLSELIDQGYAKLLYSNNLGATYGFTLSDEELQSIFGQMNKEELIYLRAQLAAARYMDNANELINGIWYIFNNRVENGDVIDDVADVYGKIVESGKIKNTMNVYLNNPQSVTQMISTLTQDERVILFQFINLYRLNIAARNSEQALSQYNDFVNTIFTNSIAGGSQLIVVELL